MKTVLIDKVLILVYTYLENRLVLFNLENTY